MSNREQRAQTLLGKILKADDEEAPSDIRSMVTMLFPTKLSTASIDEEEFVELASRKRVACDEYFIRYLAAVVPDGDVPDAELESMLKMAESGMVDDLVAALRSNISSKTEKILVQKLRRFGGRLTDTQRRSFAEAVAQVSDILSLKDVAWQHQTAFGQSAIFVSHCIRDLTSLDERGAFAERILGSSASPMWSIQLFWFLPHAREDEKNELSEDETPKAETFTKEASEALGARLAAILMDGIEKSNELPSTDFLYRALHHCVKHGAKQRVQAWTQKQLTNRPEVFVVLSSLLMQWMYDGSEREYEWPGDAKILADLGNYFDVDWLRSNLVIEKPPTRTRRNFHITAEEAAFRIFELLNKVPEEHEKQAG